MAASTMTGPATRTLSKTGAMTQPMRGRLLALHPALYLALQPTLHRTVPPDCRPTCPR
jgi:hypothetical protein